ncbi:MAG: magnesium/cobalt transporter CorA [Anaerolineales bacterium]|jgi:magnesium transporter|nr:magnesium/cobalt transporter CorA [Anaerolineales bacterium]
MIRSLYSLPGEETRTDLPVLEYANLLKNPAALLWIDFDGEPDSVTEPILTGIFRFHPLAVDDALEESHSPKVDDWDDYLYIVLNALELDEDLGAHIDELDVFLGSNYVVTHHDRPLNCVEKTYQASRRDPRHTSQGADHLLYKLIDTMVADYMPNVEKLDDKIDEIEDSVFDNPRQETIQDIFALKRALQVMRRVLTPQREVLNKLARDDFKVIDPKDRIFFRDIYDHLVRLYDLNESMRDLIGGALDTYLSAVNNRMNDIMKTLTLITTLFMPLTFITGFFGMNFFEASQHLPAWTGQAAFGLTLLSMIILPVIMFRWMKRQTWI